MRRRKGVGRVRGSFRHNGVSQASGSGWFLEAVLDSVSDCIFIKDSNLRYVFVNKAVCEFFGKPRGEILHRTAYCLYPRRTVKDIHRSDREVLEKGVSIDRPEVTVPDGKGVVHTLQTRKGPLKDAQGNATHVIAITRETTERKRMEEQLRRNEERVRAYIEQANDLIFTLDASGKISSVNQAICKTTGYTNEELVGKSPLERVMPESRDIVQSVLGKVLRGENAERIEVGVLSKDGRPIFLEVRGSTLREEGRVVGSFHIARDVTERRRIEEKLRESEKRYRLLAENADDLIYRYLLKPTRRFEYVSPSATKIVGYTPEEHYSDPDLGLKIVHPEDRSKLVKYFQGEGEFGKLVALRWIRKDGAMIWTEQRNVPVHDEEGNLVGIEGIARDVTERKQVEEKLKALHRHSMQLGAARTLDDVVNHTLDAMDFTLGFDLADFCTVEEGHIFVKSSRGVSVSPSRWPVSGPGIVAKTASTGKTLRASDVRKEPAFVDARKVTLKEEYPPTLSELAVPVLINGNVVAVLNVESSRLGAFTEKDQMLLETLAMHVASALGRLRHVETLEKLIEQRTRSLRESEEKYRSLIKNIPDITWTTDQKGNTVFISPNVERVYGYTSEEIYEAGDRLWLGRIHPDDVERVKKNYELFFTGGKTFDVEYRIQRKDGEWIWLHDRAVATYERGGVLYADGVFSDITERKRIELALQMSEEKYRSLYESSKDGIAFADMQGRVIDANQAYLGMLGYMRKEVVRLTYQQLTPEKWHDTEADIVKNQVVVRGYSDEYEKELVKKDGTVFPITIRAWLIRDEQGKPAGMWAIVRDITERKRMEERLRQSERLAAIGELAAMVGHDLRNPLTGIAGAAYYLRAKLGLGVDIKMMQMLEVIDENIENSNKIINDLLEYSRELHLELTETSVKMIVREALASVEVPRNIRLVDSTKSQPRTMVDVEKLKRVFVNLIQNAFDAMPRGGALTIISKESNGNLEIRFRDTGVGMTEETMEKIWGPFFTTKAKGMGFGLAICRRIVEAHRGSISVESTVRKGTTFIITLPIMSKSEEVE